jgi:hypothetical protein
MKRIFISSVQKEFASALAAGLIEMTLPDSPNSPTQQYRLTSRRP